MREIQFRSVQKIPAGLAVFLRELGMAALAIQVVSSNRMTNCAEVNANLMRAPRLNSNFQQRKTANFFHNTIRSQRRAAAVRVSAHTGAHPGMAGNIECNLTGRLWEFSMDQRNVDLLDRSILKSLAQAGVGVIVLCHDQES